MVLVLVLVVGGFVVVVVVVVVVAVVGVGVGVGVGVVAGFVVVVAAVVVGGGVVGVVAGFVVAVVSVGGVIAHGGGAEGAGIARRCSLSAVVGFDRLQSCRLRSRPSRPPIGLWRSCSDGDDRGAHAYRYHSYESNTFRLLSAVGVRSWEVVRIRTDQPPPRPLPPLQRCDLVASHRVTFRLFCEVAYRWSEETGTFAYGRSFWCRH